MRSDNAESSGPFLFSISCVESILAICQRSQFLQPKQVSCRSYGTVGRGPENAFRIPSGCAQSFSISPSQVAGPKTNGESNFPL
jgi:hypothetical protein